MGDLVHSPAQALALPQAVQSESLAGQGYKIDQIYSGVCREGKGVGLSGWCIEFSDPTFGAKPEGWKESGKRVKRGLYRSKDGFKINADCNGAANILRKVAAKLGFNLDGVSRGALIAPLKVRIWAVQESPSL